MDSTIIFWGIVAVVITFFIIRNKITHYVKCYKCDKWYQKGDAYCTDCHVLIVGACPNCGAVQKWKGPGCTQCGYDTLSGTAISSSPPSPVSVRTTPIPPTVPSATLYSFLCPNCGGKTPQGSTFCGSCGFNLEQTIM